jgi:hypothetical protein
VESRLDGMVRPSALAVLRLITCSNLVGSCTGRSRCDRRSQAGPGWHRSRRRPPSAAKNREIAPTPRPKTALGLSLSQGEDRTGRFLTPTSPLYPGGCDYCASHNGRNKGYSWVRLPPPARTAAQNIGLAAR